MIKKIKGYKGYKKVSNAEANSMRRTRILKKT